MWGVWLAIDRPAILSTGLTCKGKSKTMCRSALCVMSMHMSNRRRHEQQKETMMSHLLSTHPWQLVSIDLFSYTRQDFLLMVDHYSDFWEIDLLPDLAAETAIQRCKMQFSSYRIPDRVISNCGSQFDCGEFRPFAKEWGFKHFMSTWRIAYCRYGRGPISLMWREAPIAATGLIFDQRRFHLHSR